MASLIEVDGKLVRIPAEVLAKGPKAVAKFLKPGTKAATTDDGKVEDHGTS